MTCRIALLSAAALLLPRLASACPVCFGASDGPMLEGSNMGILALLVVTLAMLAAFAAFFYTLVRREARSVAAAPMAALRPLQDGSGR